MFNRVRNSYEHTIYACYLGYITQAITGNFAPLLFVTFTSSYQISIGRITLMTTVYFMVQLLVDLLTMKLADRIGYRRSLVAAHMFSAAGLLGMAAFPSLFQNAYAGLMTASVLYAAGSGMIEVLVSPVVEACPTKRKEAAMSLLHSFYCWGHVFLVVVSTVFFRAFGIGNWRILACIWALVPVFNLFYFRLVPLYPIEGNHERLSPGNLLHRKTFWLFLVIMVCAGASEVAMSQWASAFAESALKVSKNVGDLAGPCAFAAFMGTARAFYGKYSEQISLKKFMLGSAVLCVLCYLTAAFSGNPAAGLLGCALCGFSVGIFWPGTFSMAARKLPGGGTAMYALMALAGDAGCTFGAASVGMAAELMGGSLKAGLAAGVVFPAVIGIGIMILGKEGRNRLC